MKEGAAQADRCICCGEEVPEGRMVCFSCENEQQLAEALLLAKLQNRKQEREEQA